ncbi:MAG: prepilin-type N-terminal cleavage/methylation domain-containing protein [Rubrivivax sp.]|jgi:MSHA biogenesis protein MshO|nr:prepilin-type N-terminal cleavage/methylation domain-containing protein [Rubrivivax sp.]
MRPTLRSERRPPRSAGGFTLVEAVVVIVVVGIVAAVVGRFIVQPVQAYQAVAARSALVDQADLALRQVARDLRVALPNSVRTTASGLALELIPTRGAARYATSGSGALEFGVVDTSFDVVGPPLVLGAAQPLVFYNLGTGVVGSDAYAPATGAAEQAASNRRVSSNAAGAATTIGLVSAAALPAAAFAAPHRVFAVDPPVSYRCDLASGRLLRHQDYGFVATQPDPPSGGTSSVLATGVAGCRFSVEGTLVAAHAALVTLRLALATTTPSGTETVTLHHAVYVDNLP